MVKCSKGGFMNIFKKISMLLITLLLSYSFLPIKAESNVLEVFYFNDNFITEDLELELWDLEDNFVASFLKEESIYNDISWHRFWIEYSELNLEEYTIKLSFNDETPEIIHQFFYNENITTYYLSSDILTSDFSLLQKTVTYASFISRRELRFTTNFPLGLASLKLLKGDVLVEDFELKSYHLQYIITLDNDFDIAADYYLEISTPGGFSPKSTYIRHDEIYDKGFFTTLFKYDGNDLGYNYLSTSTTFKVWAPTLRSVTLNLYSIMGLKESFSMTKDSYGVFTYKKFGNLKHYEYTYSFIRNYQEYEIVDPYTKYISENNRALIVDLNSTNPNGFFSWSPEISSTDIADNVIYESSVRQLTSTFADKTLANTYNGLKETNLSIESNNNLYSIGLDHLIDLGVTHLSLNDLINSNYSFSVINKTYASNTKYTTEITELKQAVKTLNNNGINVIVDLDIYQQIIPSLEALVPGYYYETNRGSLVKNDNKTFFETSRSMTNKYLNSQILYLINEFKFSGLKISPLNSLNIDYLNEELRQLVIDNNFLIYGEFSNIEPLITTKKLTSKTLDQARHVGFIDDQRFSLDEGFNTATSDDSLKGYILSSWNQTYSTLSPEQSFKRLSYFLNRSRRANHQIKSIQLLSYGVIVLKGGEEIGQYNNNPLNYTNKDINNNLYNTYKYLLNFRKEHPSLKILDHNDLKNEVLYSVKDSVISYEIINPNDLYPDILIIHNLGDETDFLLPEGLKGYLTYNRDGEFNWQVAYDNLSHYPLKTKFDNNTNINLQKNQSVVLHFGLNKDNIIEEPIQTPEPPESPKIIFYLLISGGIIIAGGIFITYFILRSTKKEKL